MSGPLAKLIQAESHRCLCDLVAGLKNLRGLGRFSQCLESAVAKGARSGTNEDDLWLSSELFWRLWTLLKAGFELIKVSRNQGQAMLWIESSASGEVRRQLAERYIFKLLGECYL